MQTPFMNLTFCIRTFGCQMNKHDSERIAGMLEGLGALAVESVEKADIVAFMTYASLRSGRIAQEHTSALGNAAFQAYRSRGRVHRPT